MLLSLAFGKNDLEIEEQKGKHQNNTVGNDQRKIPLVGTIKEPGRDIPQEDDYHPDGKVTH
jgi:hypothetical protein